MNKRYGFMLGMVCCIPMASFASNTPANYYDGAWVHMAQNDSIARVVFLPVQQQVDVDIYRMTGSQHSQFLVEEPVTFQADHSGQYDAETTWKRSPLKNKYLSVKYLLRFYPIDLQHLAWRLTTEVNDVSKKSDEKYFSQGELQRADNDIQIKVKPIQSHVAIPAASSQSVDACPPLKINCVSKKHEGEIIGNYQLDQHSVTVKSMKECLPWFIKKMSAQEIQLASAFEQHECSIKFPHQCSNDQCISAELSE